MGDAVEITIRLHNRSVDLLEYYVEEKFDLSDYQVITPHFSFDKALQKRVLKIRTRIPNHKLILADHWMEELPDNYDAVYPDFSVDACEGLGYGFKKLKSYSKLNVVTLPLSLSDSQRSDDHFDRVPANGCVGARMRRSRIEK